MAKLELRKDLMVEKKRLRDFGKEKVEEDM